MSYDREAIKQFISDYSKENHDTTYNDENINVDDFFSLMTRSRYYFFLTDNEYILVIYIYNLESSILI